MNKKTIAFLFSFIFLISIKSISQYSYSHIRISVLTCGPGEDLYSLFGHTALRVTDTVTHQDVVYNWGGFTFEQPNFYLKFLRGKLLYNSSADNFPDFMYEYITDQRNVYEQVLYIDSVTKQKILAALNYNMLGSNRFYKYDFLLDNCTTRVRNIVLKNSAATITGKIVPDGTSSRDMIHYYLDRGNKPWTKLGIDILLGSRVDRPVNNDEAMFLPEFFMKGLDMSTAHDSLFANNARVIFQGAEQEGSSNKNVPLFVMAACCIVIFLLSLSAKKWAITTVSIFDSLLLYITGLIGILILFMWFFTDHTVCKNNLNIFWALPTNIVAAFAIFRKPVWLRKYFLITAIITALFLAFWFWLPQQINYALIPVVVLLLNRYVNLSKKDKSIIVKND